MKYTGSKAPLGDSAMQARAAEYAATMRAAMSDQSYKLPEASLRLPFDEHIVKDARALASTLIGPNLSYILDIGIGGSNLGAKALYEASTGTLDPHLPVAPKMLFADTCSPELLGDITELLLGELVSPEQIVIVVASKSGNTTETMVNASVLINALEAKLGSLASRIVCITDQDSKLWNTAKEKGFHLLAIPQMVGGRYSVFSPAGLFPLACAGIDIEAIVRGAQGVVADAVERGNESEAFLLAQDIVNAMKAGSVIADIFLFHPELESVGKWYRQLFAESIGKAMTTSGAPATHRIVPTVSIGSTDLHSVEQMNLAQPSLAFRLLVRAHAPHWEHQFLVADQTFSSLVPGIEHRAPCEVMDAIYRGVKEAYAERGVSYGEIALENLSPESLGALLELLMCTVMYLANMLEINAFDQPNVEAYKEATRRILEKGE